MRSLDLSLHESSAFGKAFLSDFAKNIILDGHLLDCVLPSEVEVWAAAFLRCSAEGCWSQDTLLLLATIFLLAVLSA